jgi:hypothetical protein
MLLLLAEQGLEAVLGLSGGLLVLGQLVTGGAQGSMASMRALLR